MPQTPLDVFGQGMNQSLNMVMQSIRGFNSLNQNLLSSLASGVPNPNAIFANTQNLANNLMSAPQSLLGNVGKAMQTSPTTSLTGLKLPNLSPETMLPRFDAFSKMSGADDAEMFGTTESDRHKPRTVVARGSDSDDASLF